MQKIRSLVMRLPQSLPHFDAIPRRSGNRGHHDENTRPAFGKTFTGITLTCGLLYIANIAIPGFGFQWNSPYIGFSICCDIGTLVFFRLHPQTASVAMILLWTAERYVPWNLPYTYVFAVLTAAATLGYLRFRLALSTCLASALTLFFIRVSSLEGTVLMSLVFLTASCGGFVFRLYQDRNHAVSQLGLHRRQEMIAGKLHDVVCNDLAYVLRQIDTLEAAQEHSADAEKEHPADTGSRTDSLAEIRQSITEALQYTRTAITTLQAADAESHETRFSGSTGSTSGNAGKTAIDIAALLNQGQGKLDHVGISGIIAAPNMGTVTMPGTTAALVEGLIREIFGNLLKYADPAKGYVLTARSDGITLHIGVSDSPRPDCRQNIPPDISPISAGTPSNASPILLDAPSSTPSNAQKSSPAGSPVNSTAESSDKSSAESPTDTMDVSSVPPLHGGTGIRSYQSRIAALGGELSVSATNDQWTLEVAVPLIAMEPNDDLHSAAWTRCQAR